MSIKYSALGSLNQREVQLEFTNNINQGINIVFPDKSVIPVSYKYITNTLRNTVLGNADNSVCFIEHLLAVIRLLELDSININILDGYEIPLLDGSGKAWYELLVNSKLAHTNKVDIISRDIPETLTVTGNKNNTIIAVPYNTFKMTYLFIHPVTQEKSWVTWERGNDINILINARTFASSLENKLLNMSPEILGYDANGFDQEFRFTDEPAYHKLLDLYGDLCLAGINPLCLNAHIISYQGSHALNTELAKLI